MLFEGSGKGSHETIDHASVVNLEPASHPVASSCVARDVEPRTAVRRQCALRIRVHANLERNSKPRCREDESPPSLAWFQRRDLHVEFVDDRLIVREFLPVPSRVGDRIDSRIDEVFSVAVEVQHVSTGEPLP